MNQLKKSKHKKYLIIFIYTFVIVAMLGVSGTFVWQHSSIYRKEKITSSKIKPPKIIINIKEKQFPSKNVQAVQIQQKRFPTNHNETADQWAYKTEEIREQMKGSIDENKPKTVFLTFDDGPSTNITPRILKILSDHNVYATFFLVGNRITPETQNIIKQEYDNGNGIAVHSFTHDYKVLYPNRVPDSQAILREAIQTRNLLKDFLGTNFDTQVWRYPGGTISWKNLDENEILMKENGFHWIDWNAATGDGVGAKGPKTVEDTVNYHAMSISLYPKSNVEVILMHDSSDKELTVQSLPSIINYYKERGYQFGILD